VKFTYRATDTAGSDVYGEVDALDKSDAERQIRSLGLSPADVERSDAPIPTPSQQSSHTDTTSDKGTGALAGCAFGWTFGLVLIVLGLILTFTGIGAIIGVPMIIVGVVLPFVGPFLGLANIKGPCPYCGSDVHATKTQPGVTCPACQRRIIIRGGQYHRVD
jgi:hypothetical protein